MRLDHLAGLFAELVFQIAHRRISVAVVETNTTATVSVADITLSETVCRSNFCFATDFWRTDERMDVVARSISSYLIDTVGLVRWDDES